MDNPEFEIARTLLKEVMRKQGIHFSGNLSKELEPLARATGIDVAGFKKVLKPIVQELIDEQFGK